MNEVRSIGKCPHCGSEVLENKYSWSCSDPGCRFMLWKENKFFGAIGKIMTPMIAETLLKNGRIRQENCVSRRTGRVFNAEVLLTTDADGTAHFLLEFDDDEEEDDEGCDPG